MRSTPPRASSFQRLARVHALMAAGDVAMTVALADSLFFDIGPDAARGRVLLFLLISIAPFAIVAPLIGPTIDRMPGGRRLVVCLVAVGRIGITIGMISYLNSLVLFPLAFAALVLQKTYAVAKASLVPAAVRSEAELVEANSKLGLISGVVGALAAVPAGILSLVSGKATLGMAVIMFAGVLLMATRLPREAPAARDSRQAQVQLHSMPVVVAASAMGLLRACVGFMFFHLAFWLRTVGGDSVVVGKLTDGTQTVTYKFGAGVSGTLWFGLAVGFAALATTIGNAVAPFLRRAVSEERMLTGVLALLTLTGIAAAVWGGIPAAIVLASVVNLSAAVGRLAFDSIVQRSAPEADRGRAFAQFETKFQLAWVVAAVVPVLLHIPSVAGFAIVGSIAGFATVTYLLSMNRIRRGLPPTTLRRTASQQLRRRRPTSGASSLPPPSSPAAEAPRPR